MKGLATLLKLSGKNFLAGFRKGSWYKDNGKLNISHIVTLLIATASLLWVAWFVLYAEIKLFEALALIGQPMLLPALTLFIAMAMTLVFGLFTVISSLYFGKDVVWKAYLPISSTTVMAAKWTEIYLGEIVLNTAIVAPAAILYGMHIQGEVLYYLRALMVLLATPLIPMMVTTVLSTLLVRISGLFRHRESLLMAGSVLVVVVVVGLEMMILPSLPEDTDAMYFVGLLLSNEGLVKLLLSAFPPLMWAAQGLAGQNLQALMFIGLSLAAAAVAIAVIGPHYLTLCLQQSEQGTKRRKMTLRRDAWKTQSPLMALVQREWRELIRTPIYAFNAFSGVVMVPIMIIAMGMGLSSASEGEMNIAMMLDEVLQLFSGTDFMLILTALLSFACFMNPAAGTAVSREGGRLSISRMIPVKPSQQINAKLLVGLFINLTAQLVSVLLLGFVLNQHAVWLVPAMALATLFSYTTTAATLTIDTIKPQLKWENENQAMKQNLNMIFSMLLNLVLFALPIVVFVLLHRASPMVRCMAAVGVIALEAVMAFLLLHFIAQRRYAEMEG